MFRQHITEGSKIFFRNFGWGLVSLLFLTTVAGARPVQTVDSEAQVAAMLCRNPGDAAANELLNKDPKFVSVSLWNALVDCASSAQREESLDRTIGIYRLTVRVA